MRNNVQHNSTTHLNISLIDSIKQTNIDFLEVNIDTPQCTVYIEIADQLVSKCSVGLLRSAYVIVSIVNIKTLASHISDFLGQKKTRQYSHDLIFR